MKKQESEYVEAAAQLQKNGHNCAQAVAVAFQEDVQVDPSLLFKIAEGFGRGMGNTEGTCGALSGAIMVISFLNSGGDPHQVTKQATYAIGGTAYQDFIARTGSIVCKELQGLDTGVPLCSCEKCIEEAVKITYEVLS